MSSDELKKLQAGEILENHKNFSKDDMSESVGFCFLPETVTFDSYDGYAHTYTAAECYIFLQGIVSDDYFVKLDIPSNELNESYGMYADPYGPFKTLLGIPLITIKELCTESYSLKTAKILSAQKMTN